MKRVLLTLVLLTSLLGHADWIKLGVKNDRVVMIHSDTPRQINSYIYSAWTLMVLPKVNEDNIRAYRSYSTYNCKTGGRKLLHLTSFDNNGNILQDFNTESMSSVEYDDPEGPGGLAIKKICGK